MGRRRALLAILALGMPPAAAPPLRAGPPPYRRLMGTGETGLSVKWAVEGAQARLSRESCRRVLDDFRDASGRTLRENLDILALSPRAYLEAIAFYDAADAGRCRSSTVLAMTMPGSRAVMVCGARFAAARRGNPRLAEVVIIHEALHTLGLGENPPTSSDITARVFLRCGA